MTLNRNLILSLGLCVLYTLLKRHYGFEWGTNGGNEGEMESNLAFDESLDYEYDKENENIPNVPEKVPTKEEVKKDKLNKEEKKKLLKTMKDLEMRLEKLKEEIFLKSLSRRSYAYTSVHRPERSYSRSRQNSSPYSWSAKKM